MKLAHPVSSSTDVWLDLVEASVTQKERPLILDVRSESEFAESSIPYSVNIPILNDEERRLVGIEYKSKGQQAAIDLGLKLVDEEARAERLRAWRTMIEENRIRYVTCWRGGLRSAFAQAWLAETGLSLWRVEGGSKTLRRRALSVLQSLTHSEFGFVLHGRTGCGKTKILREISSRSQSFGFLDLEACAEHRGSAFGHKIGASQPSQITFEYRLALAIERIRRAGKRILIEGESRTIGSCVVPHHLFQLMETLPVVVLEASEDERVSHIFEDYFVEPQRHFSAQQVCDEFIRSLRQLGKRLGSERLNQYVDQRLRAHHDRNEDLNRDLIRRLLQTYYDPVYDRHLLGRKDRIVFRGGASEICGNFHLGD